MERDPYRLIIHRERFGTDSAQQPIQRSIIPYEEVQQGQPLGVAALHFSQRLNFITEQIERQAGILDGIVPRVRQELVPLYESVIWI